MKKYIVGGALVVAFIAYIIFFNNNQPPIAAQNSPITSSGSGAPAAAGGTGSGGTGTGTGAGAGAGSGAGSSGNTPNAPASGSGGGNSSASSGQYKNGTYTGPAASAFYGNVQVVATVSGGKLTNIQIAQYPHAEGYSIQVASVAMPILMQEAVQTQSANVNAVSGATEDSMAFQQSLAGALAQAKA